MQEKNKNNEKIFKTRGARQIRHLTIFALVYAPFFYLFQADNEETTIIKGIAVLLAFLAGFIDYNLIIKKNYSKTKSLFVTLFSFYFVLTIIIFGYHKFYANSYWKHQATTSGYTSKDEMMKDLTLKMKEKTANLTTLLTSNIQKQDSLAKQLIDFKSDDDLRKNIEITKELIKIMEENKIIKNEFFDFWNVEIKSKLGNDVFLEVLKEQNLDYDIFLKMHELENKGQDAIISFYNKEINRYQAFLDKKPQSEIDILGIESNQFLETYNKIVEEISKLPFHSVTGL